MRETPLAVRRRVGRMVRQLRLQRELTQEQLAELAGDSPKHLSLVENGKVNVTINGLTRIAGGLSVPVVDLFGPASRTARAYLLSSRDLDLVSTALRAVDRVRRERGPRAKID